MTKKNTEKKERTEGQDNVVISVGFANDLLNYLNSKPRSETNNLCIGLEKSPSVEKFNKMVMDHYNEV